MHKRRWVVLTLIVILLSGTAFSIASLIERRAARERQTRYAAALKEYSDEIKPSTSRQEVEAYLQLRNRSFGQMCCVRAERRAYADLVEVGQEKAPWFCNRNTVYIAFEFETTEPHGLSADARGSDRLESVTLFPRLEQCL
jgi:hypothetical protein